MKRPLQGGSVLERRQGTDCETCLGIALLDSRLSPDPSSRSWQRFLLLLRREAYPASYTVQFSVEQLLPVTRANTDRASVWSTAGWLLSRMGLGHRWLPEVNLDRQMLFELNLGRQLLSLLGMGRQFLSLLGLGRQLLSWLDLGRLFWPR